MMQEQHDKQIAAIMAANKSSMDEMMEKMNALAAGKGFGKGNQKNDKENIKPKDDNKDKTPPLRNKHTCPHCKLQVLHKAKNCPELEENAARRWTGWKSVNDTGKPWQGPGTQTVDEIANNLITTYRDNNYWSPLTWLVEDQEEEIPNGPEQKSPSKMETALSATGNGIEFKKQKSHWERKCTIRRLKRLAFLDSGATSGAAPEEVETYLEETGQPSEKTFMFPDGRTGKATKKMLLRHNLRLAAREMNIVPGLQTTLISIPKLADAGYTTVFKKDGAAVYDDYTTTVTASSKPVLEQSQQQANPS